LLKEKVAALNSKCAELVKGKETAEKEIVRQKDQLARQAAEKQALEKKVAQQTSEKQALEKRSPSKPLKSRSWRSRLRGKPQKSGRWRKGSLSMTRRCNA
jgi:chromosome segregation ATPase